MSLNGIAEQQGGWFANWFVFRQPLGALIFFIAATAEANRTPFDLTEADSEIVAGFATEYSGMRFGFLFFAEYVNVFIVSALIVTLFFGAWNAPVDLASLLAWANPTLQGWFGVTLQPPVVALDPGSLGIGLLLLVLVAPVLLTLLFALPVFLLRTSRPAWQALLIGFVLFNVVAAGGAFTLAWIGWDWVAGLVWFMIKSFLFVFVFVWMRATFPRVRIDHLMGFAWKWLLPAALLNLFLTASALVVANSL
jgi:NADH-quinone oxidoreductase subunit H